jgi:type IV secretory pathway VirB4 component
LEVSNLGNLENDWHVRHFLDFDSSDEFSSKDVLESLSSPVKSFFKFAQETNKYFVGNWYKYHDNKAFSFSQILETNLSESTMGNGNVFDEITSAITTQSVFNEYAFHYLKDSAHTQLNTNLLNIFVRGTKGTGKSTLALALLNRLLGSGGIKGILIFGLNQIN